MSDPASDPVGHIPVLPREVEAYLEAKPGGVVLDCTLGRGGHAAQLIPKIGPGGTYVGLDLDPGNAAFAEARVRPIAEEAGVTLHIVHSNFADAPAALAGLGLEQVDGLLADLGFASNQVDDPDRGMSFLADGPLDMRLNPEANVTAEILVNTLPERELADVIYQLGEERLSRRIARKIVETRATSPIKTTSQLADLVRQAYGRRGGQSRIHPATRTFMALRIATNHELDALDELLASLPGLLAPGGRAVLISFHSLEDRKVKQAFLKLSQSEELPMTRLTRKPVMAGDDEIAGNTRSRSAKLRAVQRDG